MSQETMSPGMRALEAFGQNRARVCFEDGHGGYFEILDKQKVASIIERETGVTELQGKLKIADLALVEVLEENQTLRKQADALAKALDSIAEYWNQSENDRAMSNALEYMQNTACAALAAYRKETP